MSAITFIQQLHIHNWFVETEVDRDQPTLKEYKVLPSLPHRHCCFRTTALTAHQQSLVNQPLCQIRQTPEIVGLQTMT